MLDPLEDDQTFLLFALVLGVVQVFFGVVLAAIDAFKRGDAASAVFDHLSIIMMFGLIAVSVVSGDVAVAGGGPRAHHGRAGAGDHGRFRPLGVAMWDRAVGWAWLASVVWVVVAFAVGGVNVALAAFLVLSIVGPVISKTARRAVLGMLGGAYAVYGMTAFVGDMLSYLRLAALGLSGTLVGCVFNLLAGLVWVLRLRCSSGGRRFLALCWS